jgi:hypothetical protein
LAGDRLKNCNPCSLEALGAFLDGELDLLAFLKSPVAIRLNRGIMNEYIRTTLALNEAITLARIEPFYLADNTITHFLKSPYKMVEKIFRGNRIPMMFRSAA